MTVGPASSAPCALGIDDDLESALLAGLADPADATPGEPGGLTLEADLDLPGSSGGSMGDPATPPAGRADPEVESGPREALDLAGPAPEAPLNGALAPPPGLEEAPGGAFPEPPPLSLEDRDAATGGRRPDGPFDPSPVDVAPEEPPAFAFEPETAPQSALTPDEGPAKVPSVSVAARDALPERFGPPESWDGLPDGPGRGGLLDGERAAFESSFGPEPGFEPGFKPDIDTGAREAGSAGHLLASVADWRSPAVAEDPDLERTLRDGLSPGDPLPGNPAAPPPGAGADSGPPPPSGSGSTPPPEALALDPERDPEPGPDLSLPGGAPPLSGAPAVEPAPPPFAGEPAAAATPGEQAPASGREEPAILAFAADAES